MQEVLNSNNQVCYYIEANAQIPVIQAAKKAYEITYFYYIDSPNSEMTQDSNILKYRQLRRIKLNGPRLEAIKHFDGAVSFNNNGLHSQEIQDSMKIFLGSDNLFNGSLVNTNTNNKFLSRIRNVYEHLCANKTEIIEIFAQVLSEAIVKFIRHQENKTVTDHWQLISLIDILYLIHEYELKMLDTPDHLNKVFQLYKPRNISNFTDLKGHFKEEKRW